MAASAWPSIEITSTAPLQAADADLAALAAGTAGTLRVGTYPSAGVRILPPVMRRFISRYPDIAISLSEDVYQDELLAHTERGRLDLNFVVLPIDDRFVAEALLHDHHVLLVQRASPLAQRTARPTLAECGALPLIGYHRSSFGVEGFLRDRAIEPRIVFRSDDNGIVQGLVAAGVGSALVPRLTVDLTDPDTVALDMSHVIPARVIGIAHYRDRHLSAAAHSFIEVARTVCTELEHGAG